MRLILHPEARDEFREAALRYASTGTRGLGERFCDAVAVAFQAAREYPIRHAPLHGEFRRVRLRRFPYAVIYAPREDAVFVVAVAHDRRRPGYWSGRMAR
jgi:plasmid stabilization system protein ParE